MRRTVSAILALAFAWHTVRRTGSGLNQMALRTYPSLGVAMLFVPRVPPALRKSTNDKQDKTV